MAAMWILLGKTQFRARLIDSSPRHGVRVAKVPFEIAAEFTPNATHGVDETLERRSVAASPSDPGFEYIVGSSPELKRLLRRAAQAAKLSAPVLIEGESGTGKELIARAIHDASPRRGRPCLAINCGAIHPNMLEAELFGYRKGAFTGAMKDYAGLFRSADGGTLFLDEVGELPPSAQVSLLRVLQQREVFPIGLGHAVRVNVRVVAATNRTLLEEVAAGRFREDLFYRLAVLTLHLPPVRERKSDVPALVDHFLEEINQELRRLGEGEKKLSPDAKKLLWKHPWPGNVREIQGTLMRAAVWSEGATIRADDVRDAFLRLPEGAEERVLDRPLGEGFSLEELLRFVGRHYLSRALEEAQGNRTKAAALVGLPSRQTFNNWMKTHAER